jgi:hypothetical protein
VVFLALGLLLGFVAALLLHKPEKDPPGDPYALGLSVVRNGENLELTWDPRIPAVRRALRGTLVITDGDRTTPRQLSPQELEVGKAVYRRTSNNIVFLLQVFTAENTSLSEKTELHLAGGSAAAAPGGSGQEPAAEEPPSTARRRRGRR